MSSKANKLNKEELAKRVAALKNALRCLHPHFSVYFLAKLHEVHVFPVGLPPHSPCLRVSHGL